jgi:hypothetical protein
MSKPKPPTEAEQQEWLEKVAEAEADLARVDPVTDEYVGRSPEEQEERDAKAAAAAALSEDLKSTVLERQVQRLEEAMREQAELVQKLMRQQGAMTIEEVVEGALDSIEYDEHRAFAARCVANGGHVTIQIHRSGNDTTDFDVPVVVNGRKWVLPRGVAKRVPFQVYEALNNAVVTGTVREVGSDGHPHERAVRRHAFPFTVIASDGDAVLARQAELALPVGA